MAANFDSYLDVEIESIDAPKPIPEGHYFADIKSWKTTEVEYQKGTKTPIVQLDFRITGPDDDVEMDLMPEGNGVGRIVNRNYTLNDENGPFMIRKLAEETCQLDTKGLKLKDVLPQLIGQPVKVHIKHRMGGPDGDQAFPQVDKVLPAE